MGYGYQFACFKENAMKGRINTERSVEDELKVRPGGGRHRPASDGQGHWEFRGTSAAQRLHRLGRRGSGGGSGTDPRQQRVVVKAAYTVHRAGSARGVLAAHTRYLARDSASLDGREGRFYDAAKEDVDAKQQVRKWEADRHHFRFIVSPENGAEIDRRSGGLAAYVREVMAKVERDLGTKLEWVAITHHNTDDLHAHVLVRGRQDNGKDLVIPRRYVQHGMRQAAAEVATRWIGPRSAEQVQEAGQREVTANRYTPLDAAIERRLGDNRQLRLRDDDASPEGRRRMAARLAHLETLGLAERDRHGRWTVDADLRQTLRDLAERDDILKNLYPRLGPRAGAADRYGGEPVAGRVVGRGSHDELRDQRYVAVQDAAGRVHYVLPANPRALGPLEEGGVVRVSASDRGLARTDGRLAEVARANGGQVTVESIRATLAAGLSKADADGLIGSYQRRLRTLQKAGAAVATEGGWTIADVDALARGDHARSPRGHGFVEVVSARSVAAQADAAAWTWLDRQLYLRSAGKPTAVPFDPELEAAAAARQRWTVDHGHARRVGDRYTLRPGARDALGEEEWQAVSPELRRRFGGSPQPLRPGGQVAGTYRGTVALHAGLHAAVTDGDRVHLVPVERLPPLAAGATVRASVSAAGRGILVANAGRSADRDAGRG
jgi:type IV secretory pathway VirD2 relaxase